MRSIEALIDDIESLNVDGSLGRHYLIAEEIEKHPEGATCIPSVLQLFERNPDGDFGVPGPLVHAIEKYSGRGYEACLLESLNRHPTTHTLWLAHRIVNTHDENEPAFASFAEKFEELLN
ncbi:MAG: hypothetical protein U0791_19370 [Gemmataceae bacterium]